LIDLEQRTRKFWKSQHTFVPLVEQLPIGKQSYKGTSSL